MPPGEELYLASEQKFEQRFTILCYITNIKSLGCVETDKKIFKVFIPGICFSLFDLGMQQI